MIKKMVSVCAGVVLFASPLLASAQTTQASVTIQASLIAALTQLVQMLEQELQQLIAAHGSTTPATQLPAPMNVPTTLNSDSITIDQALSAVQATPTSDGTGDYSIPGFSGTVSGTSKLRIVVRNGTYTGPTDFGTADCLGTSIYSQYCANTPNTNSQGVYSPPVGYVLPISFSPDLVSVSNGRWQTHSIVFQHIPETLTVLVYDGTVLTPTEQAIVRTTVNIAVINVSSASNSTSTVVQNSNNITTANCNDTPVVDIEGNASLALTDSVHVYGYGPGCPALSAADPKTFVALSEFYGKDATHVWFLGGDEYYGGGDGLPPAQIMGADLATFALISDPAKQRKDGFSSKYTKDKNHVYLFGQIIPGADPATFVSDGPPDFRPPILFGTSTCLYDAHDVHNYYYEGSKVPAESCRAVQ